MDGNAILLGGINLLVIFIFFKLVLRLFGGKFRSLVGIGFFVLELLFLHAILRYFGIDVLAPFGINIPIDIRDITEPIFEFFSSVFHFRL